MPPRRFSVFFRNFIFGVEDSLVSTVGLLSGIAIANVPSETIVLTGVVLIFVEAFSMSAGSLLSESSAESYETGAEGMSRASIGASIVMFFSYFLSGFVPLSAYIFWPTETAFTLSITFSLIALFVLGIIGAKLSKTRILRNGLRMAIIGGLAVTVGTFAGAIMPALG
jgi:VIT1/CCC1 family predicted Fe2+/Mn2+ transporter